MDHEDGDGDGAGLDGGVDGDSGGWRRPPEAIPAVFPPSDLLWRQPSVFCFVVLCFSAASSRSPSGAIFRVGFRSRRSRGRKDRQQRSHEAPEGGPLTAKESGRVGHPLFGPQASPRLLPSLPSLLPS